MKKQILCSKCKSNNIIKWCKRKTENRGLIQRYKCKDCGKYFIIDDGFFRMRNTPQKITLCLDLFYRGVSTRKVQEHLQAFYPYSSDHSTILRWLWKYSKIISNYTNQLKLNVGSEIQVDEIEYHRRLDHSKGSKGAEKNFFIDSIDPTTKFMVASEYAKSRDSKNIKVVVKRAKERTQSETQRQIKKVTTDGWMAYNKVIKNVFGYNLKENRYNVIHNRVPVSEKEEVFNYPIERLHNNVRARTKVFRGFHGSLRSANLILKGYEIYYNFIRINQAINKCPYELACPELKDKLGVNKWLDLIRLSNQQSI